MAKRIYLTEIGCYLRATSTSTVLVGTGLKTFQVSSGPLPAEGMKLRIESSLSPSTYMEGIVVELTGDTFTLNATAVAGSGTLSAWTLSEGTLFFTNAREYNDPTAPGWFDPRVQTTVRGSQSIFGDGLTFGGADIGVGQIKVSNMGGVRDKFRKYGFYGRKARILVGYDDQPYASFTVFLTGTVEQAVVSQNDVLFRFRNRLSELKKPVISDRFKGDNVAPNGVEGTTDIEGRFKPLLRGWAGNFTPILVNESKRVYILSARQIHGVAYVKDGGVSMTLGSSSFANLAAFLAATPATNTYNLYLGNDALGEGAYIMLAGKPIYTITCGAWEGATAADRYAAAIFRRVLLTDAGYSTSDIVDADFTAVNSEVPCETGFWVTGGGSEEDIAQPEAPDEFGTVKGAVSVKDALDTLCPGARMWYSADPDGKFRIGTIKIPSGTPVLTFRRFDRQTAAGINEFNLKALEIVATNDGARGVPLSRVALKYAHNYTQQQGSDLGGDQTSDTDTVGGLVVREILRRQYQMVTYPTSGQDPDVIKKFGVALEETFITELRHRADAQALVQYLFTIYGVQRDRFKLTSTLDPGIIPATRLGSLVGVQLPRFGLDAGKVFTVLGVEYNLDANEVVFDLWGAT